VKRVLFGGAAVLAAFTLFVQNAAAQKQSNLMAAQSPGRWSRTTAHLPTNVPAGKGPNLMVYGVTNGVQFGAEDLRSGAFVPIGPGLVDSRFYGRPDRDRPGYRRSLTGRQNRIGRLFYSDIALRTKLGRVSGQPWRQLVRDRFRK
jgi:hypothetical protein